MISSLSHCLGIKRVMSLWPTCSRAYFEVNPGLLSTVLTSWSSAGGRAEGSGFAEGRNRCSICSSLARSFICSCSRDGTYGFCGLGLWWFVSKTLFGTRTLVPVYRCLNIVQNTSQERSVFLLNKVSQPLITALELSLTVSSSPSGRVRLEDDDLIGKVPATSVRIYRTWAYALHETAILSTYEMFQLCSRGRCFPIDFWIPKNLDATSWEP